MANIVLKTYAAGENNQGSVTPQNDALIYQATIPMNGIFSGAVITLSSANVLHVAAGMGIIGGRFFEVLESDIPVQLSVSGDLLGRLYIHLDLSNADNPIEINAVTGASLPALQGDPDLNISNGVFDMELCTFDINELTISNIVQTFPTITAANNQIRRATAYSVNDFALCQSASDALIFICTTAGTTAVQQPTGYTTITDGNTITDGTAVFKAVSVSGQITKLSKTEVLISNSGDVYSSSIAYSVGDYVIHDDKLYRCITACSAGSWSTNSSCFTQDTLVNARNTLNPVYDTINIGTHLIGTGYPLRIIRMGNLRILIYQGSKNLTVNTYTQIGTLPSGDRPSSVNSVMGSANVTTLSFVVARSTGEIEVNSNETTDYNFITLIWTV